MTKVTNAAAVASIVHHDPWATSPATSFGDEPPF